MESICEAAAGNLITRCKALNEADARAVAKSSSATEVKADSRIR